MKLKEFSAIWRTSDSLNYDEGTAKKEFKNFSEEFLKLYQDIDNQEPMFVGAVQYLVS